MATIHVVYDPSDRMAMMPPERRNQFKLSVAAITLADTELDHAEIERVMKALAEQLLEQIAKG